MGGATGDLYSDACVAAARLGLPLDVFVNEEVDTSLCRRSTL